MPDKAIGDEFVITADHLAAFIGARVIVFEDCGDVDNGVW